MTEALGGPLGVATVVAQGLLAAGFVLALFRLVRGPDVVDRVVALDLLAVLAAGMVAVYSVATDEALLVDVALVLALVAFLATLAFGWLVHPEEEPG